MDKNISDQFIDRIFETAARTISKAEETEARRCLLDYLGAASGGAKMLGSQVNAYLDRQPACAGVTVINTGRGASLQNAALCNGMMAHIYDIDDGNRLTSIHLAGPIISAVLSVSEWNDLTLEDVFRGIITGYEAANRLGKCLQPHHRKRGFHASGTLGTIGAALGAAATLRYTKEEMKTALSAACTSAAGILEMQENVSKLKPVNIGRAAHDGVTAALLAGSGFIGPEDPLCGKFGFLKAVADEWDLSALTDPVPQSLTVLGTYHKIHASCRHTHAAVDAARALMQENPEKKPSDITDIEIRMYEQGVKGHDHTVVESPVSGKMSIPFAVALALVKGSVGFSDFTDSNIFDEQVQRLCKAGRVIIDDALTAQAPAIRESVVTLKFADGSSLTGSVKYPKGEPEYPLSEADIRQKFADLASCGELPEETKKKIADLVLSADKELPVKDLMSL